MFCNLAGRGLQVCTCFAVGRRPGPKNAQNPTRNSAVAANTKSTQNQKAKTMQHTKCKQQMQKICNHRQRTRGGKLCGMVQAWLPQGLLNIYIYVHTHIHLLAYVRIYVHTHYSIYIYGYVYMYMYIRMIYVCTHIYMRTCICMYMYVVTRFVCLLWALR